MRSFLAAGAIGVATFWLYALNVDTIPPSVAEDEIRISMTAHSIATTGTDLAGRAWPLYIQVTEGSWFHPVIVYSIALVLQVLPLSEFAIRLPTVLAGVANVVLMYFIARVLFRREGPAILAAILLALTPTHFLHSRFALEYLYPLPFISAWLLCLFVFHERHDARWLFAGTFFLGLGFYSYIASVLMMPLYVLLTAISLVSARKSFRSFVPVAAGFSIPLIILLVPWALTHQSAFDRTVGHYLIYDTSTLNPLQGLRELFSRTSIAARTTLYWEFLNPSFLFLDLTAPFMYSTRTTGVFLLPFVVFVPVGLYHALRGADPRRLTVALGFLTAPFAAVLVGEGGAIGRALELLPFGVLLAMIGIVHMWSGPQVPLRRVLCFSASAIGLVIAIGYGVWTLWIQGQLSSSTPTLLVASVLLGVIGLAPDRAAWRIAVAALLLAAGLQFRHFLNDYFDEYPSRATEAFRFNRRGALEYLIERSRTDTVPAVYLGGLGRDVDVIQQYWKFYLIKHARLELLPRTMILGDSPVDVTTIPPASAILVQLKDATAQALANAGEITLETLIPEPGGQAFFAVYRRR